MREKRIGKINLAAMMVAANLLVRPNCQICISDNSEERASKVLYTCFICIKSKRPGVIFEHTDHRCFLKII